MSNELQKRYEQESKIMQERVAQMTTKTPDDERKKLEAEHQAFLDGVKAIRKAAAKQGHHIYTGKDSMGCDGFRVVDENSIVIGGENYELDLATVASWYGVKV